MKATQYRRLSGAVSNSAKRSSELCPGIVSSRSPVALSGASMSAQRSRQPPSSGVGSAPATEGEGAIQLRIKPSSSAAAQSTDPEVLLLQHYLNTHGFPVAASGDGSPGREITTF